MRFFALVGSASGFSTLFVLLCLLCASCLRASAPGPAGEADEMLEGLWERHQAELANTFRAFRLLNWADDQRWANPGSTSHLRLAMERAGQARERASELGTWLSTRHTPAAIYFGLNRERDRFSHAVTAARVMIESFAGAAVAWREGVEIKLDRLHRLLQAQLSDTLTLKRIVISRHSGYRSRQRYSLVYTNLRWLQSTYANQLDRYAILLSRLDADYRSAVPDWEDLFGVLRGDLARLASGEHRLPDSVRDAGSSSSDVQRASG
ncbi:uncharacterized protein PFL1_01472 [Pseudozyma flocculosa PF-1]|uniref:Uncharacterized protein n=1 Tax=Pseudozyma flocculosa TaxID=84751 RepID=A0A5C3FBM6_9BASI|nr:uncharacterized protein PFL1_01472 [Pseudozyma flocculosa PF-1]EPQ31287.1 hypothetical protein PFL1_01472 [Pseudozyma flocculosa PF-1]SPO41748.1 uncharacterized protein PSFLO_07230 [Pseudozyma flocculosa]